MRLSLRPLVAISFMATGLVSAQAEPITAGNKVRINVFEYIGGVRKAPEPETVPPAPQVTLPTQPQAQAQPQTQAPVASAPEQAKPKSKSAAAKKKKKNIAKKRSKPKPSDVAEAAPVIGRSATDVNSPLEEQPVPTGTVLDVLAGYKATVVHDGEGAVALLRQAFGIEPKFEQIVQLNRALGVVLTAEQSKTLVDRLPGSNAPPAADEGRVGTAHRLASQRNVPALVVALADYRDAARRGDLVSARHALTKVVARPVEGSMAAQADALLGIGAGVGTAMVQ